MQNEMILSETSATKPKLTREGFCFIAIFRHGLIDGF